MKMHTNWSVAKRRRKEKLVDEQIRKDLQRMNDSWKLKFIYHSEITEKSLLIAILI